MRGVEFDSYVDYSISLSARIQRILSLPINIKQQYYHQILHPQISLTLQYISFSAVAAIGSLAISIFLLIPSVKLGHVRVCSRDHPRSPTKGLVIQVRLI